LLLRLPAKRGGDAPFFVGGAPRWAPEASRERGDEPRARAPRPTPPSFASHENAPWMDG
jgi:hypothetical protein